MADVDFRVEPGVGAHLARRGGDVDGAMKLRAERVAERARQLAPEGKTGALRRSIVVEQPRDSAGRFTPGWDVVANVPYAIFVHEGTRPHVIEGRPLLVFDWEVTGRTMFLPRVQHPGTAAQPFLSSALSEAV